MLALLKEEKTMANHLLSVRLTLQLAATLDRMAGHLGCSPSRLVERLLCGGEPYQTEVLKSRMQGPFPEKRNLRLSPGAIQRLRRLTGDTESGAYIRSLLAYFFSHPHAFRAVVPIAPREEAWAHLLEEAGPTARTAETHRAARPGHSWAGILFLSMLLVPLVIGILDLFTGSTHPEGPHADPGPPLNPSSKEGK